MTQPPTYGWLGCVFWVLVVALAGTVRWWYVTAVPTETDAQTALVRVQDDTQAEWSALSQRLQQEKAFTAIAPLGTQPEPTAHVSPGYPFFLYGLAQLQQPNALRWGQLALGAVSAGLWFAFAWRAFHNPWVAGLAGLLCALHPYYIVNTSETNDGVLVTFVLALCLFLGTRSVQTSGPLSSLLFGVSLAGLALVRASCLPFALFALVWFLWRCRKLPKGWLCAIVAFLGFANGLLPWVIRNVQRFHEPVPIISTSYWHLWVGNHPQATGGPRSEQQLQTALHEQFPSDDPEQFRETLANQTQVARYSSLARPVLNEVRENPTATVRRRLYSGLCFVFGETLLQDIVQGRASSLDSSGLHGKYPGVFSTVLLVMLLLAPLGWRWSQAWRRESLPSGLAMILIPLPYVLSHAEALPGPRLPLDGLLWCYVAFAVIGCIPGQRKQLLKKEQQASHAVPAST